MVSPRTDVAPSSTRRSLATPRAGFAVIPESASEPPHSRPRTIALHGAGTRSCALASFTNALATLNPSDCIFSSEPSSGNESVVDRVSPRAFAPSIIDTSSLPPIVRNRTAKLFGFDAYPLRVKRIRAKSLSTSPDQSWLMATAPSDASAIERALDASAECSGRINT